LQEVNLDFNIMAINNLKDSKPSQAVIEGFKKFNEMWEADTIDYSKMNKEKSETKPQLSLCIKICGDPHCDAIFHNCPDEAKKCLDCGGKLIKINEKTYQSKFALNFFQYDYKVGNDEYYRPNECYIKQEEEKDLQF